MTVLAACQQASRLMNIEPPTSVFGSSDPYPKELAAVANESATAIAKAYDWRLLTVLAIIAGDGTKTAFDLPDNYDRMPVKGLVYSTRSQLPLTHVDDLDTWLDMDIRNWTDVIGRWIMLGGQFQLKPVLQATENAKFYYISNEVVKAQSSALKTEFDADDDSYRLPERLLSLDIIWRWRKQKGLDYAEDMTNFEIAKSEEIGRDRGARKIYVGKVRVPSIAQGFAYPGVINNA